MTKILIIFGTRPEFIKLLPIILHLKKEKKIKLYVCNSGQHKELLQPFLNFYKINIDYNLNIFKRNQSLSLLSSKLLKKTQILFVKLKPNFLIVQGDTSTALMSSISAFYNKIKIFHIEAGLRTNNIYSPWPEEINRQFISKISFHHFVPSDNARKNLVNEGISKNKITKVGNTVIDLLFITLNLLKKNKALLKKTIKKFDFLNHNKFNVLITVHRRENFGKKSSEIFRAVSKILKYKDVNIVYIQHENQIKQNEKKISLKSNKNFILLQKLDYNEFVYLMSSVDLIMSDSGGIQEEAPSLGKPLMILRDFTERPETITSSAAILVPPQYNNIIKNFNKLYLNNHFIKKMSKKKNLYGEGNSAELISNKILKLI